MADLRIFSYLPNPRLYKATIAARYSGATIEIVGAAPPELPGWLWDIDARPIAEGERGTPEFEAYARKAKRGFSGTLYKTDRFLEANPFGDVPAAFGAEGRVGLFESHSIMRAAARLGPDAASICGDSPLEQSRIDAFLDRILLFARDVQPYLFAGGSIPGTPMPEHVASTMAATLTSLAEGLERALGTSAYVAGESLSLADIALVCEICLLSNEGRFAQALTEAGHTPLVPTLRNFDRLWAHLRRLAAEPRIAEDLGEYFPRMGLVD